LKKLYSNFLKLTKVRLTLEHLWCLTVMIGIFAFLNTHPIRPQDFWWHMAVGRDIVTTHQIPAADTFSQLMTGTPYPSYQAFWLMEIVLYGIYTLGGTALVVFLHSITITSAYGLVLWLCYQKSRSWRIAAFCTLFAAALGLNDWNVRPQAIAFPIGVLFMLAIHNLNGAHPNRRWLAVFPIGMLIWINSHGTFPIGFLLLGLWLLNQTWLALKAHPYAFTAKLLPSLSTPLLALALTLLAALLNPRGIGALTYVQAMSTDPVIQNMVPEWAPPSFDTFAGKSFLIGLLLSTLLIVLSRKRLTVFEGLTFLAFAVLALKTTRGILWFGLMTAPLLATCLQALAAVIAQRLHVGTSTDIDIPPTPQQQRLNTLLAVVLLAGALISLPWFKTSLPLPTAKSGIISQETPVAATAFLLQQPQSGPLFHAMSFGSYLIWAAQPEYPVFVDSRIELYPLSVWRDYIDISNAADNWEEQLEHYAIRTLMLSPKEQPYLLSAIRSHPEWHKIYEDSAAVLFISEVNQP
jgi:hypothetical protein